MLIINQWTTYGFWIWVKNKPTSVFMMSYVAHLRQQTTMNSERNKRLLTPVICACPAGSVSPGLQRLSRRWNYLFHVNVGTNLYFPTQIKQSLPYLTVMDSVSTPLVTKPQYKYQKQCIIVLGASVYNKRMSVIWAHSKSLILIIHLPINKCI